MHIVYVIAPLMVALVIGFLYEGADWYRRLQLLNFAAEYSNKFGKTSEDYLRGLPDGPEYGWCVENAIKMQSLMSMGIGVSQPLPAMGIIQHGYQTLPNALHNMMSRHTRQQDLSTVQFQILALCGPLKESLQKQHRRLFNPLTWLLTGALLYPFGLFVAAGIMSRSTFRTIRTSGLGQLIAFALVCFAVFADVVTVSTSWSSFLHILHMQ